MENDFFREKDELDRDLWELEKRRAGRRKFESILKIYSMMGIVVAIFGIAYFLLATLDVHLTFEQQIALLISGVGFALSAASWSLLKMRRERLNDDINKLKSMQELSEFLWKWSKFEEISKALLSETDLSYNRRSIREVIDMLLQTQIISRSDALVLDEAIQTRNLAVHRGSEIPESMISKYSEKLDKIIDKILDSKRF